MNKPVIICIDDEPTVIESLKIELKKAVGNECIIETAEGGKDALELVNELLAQGSEVAVVLSDYIMPDIKGDEVLSKIHTLSPNTLKIMLTGQASLEAVGKAIQNARLYRYIAKPWQPEDLKLTIVEAVHSYLQDKKLTEQNIKLKSLNAELERLNQFQAEIIAERTAALEEVNLELRRLVNLDGLTALANRRHFDEYLLHEWTRLSREESPISLVLCDVDFFKQYNDTLGHLLGDDCLKAIAKALAAAAKRPADLVARYGGEEFAMILPNTKEDGAHQVAENMRLGVRALHINHPVTQSYVTISAGVATLIPSPNLIPSDLIACADQALLRAKEQGKNRVVVYE
jgi:diguanylate cyclase (GGDEF)-like protein